MWLSAIFREAVKRGYVARNPVRGIKQLPEQNEIVRYLSNDEEQRLMEACTPGLRDSYADPVDRHAENPHRAKSPHIRE